MTLQHLMRAIKLMSKVSILYAYEQVIVTYMRFP
jgi:hypothetical protein